MIQIYFLPVRSHSSGGVKTRCHQGCLPSGCSWRDSTPYLFSSFSRLPEVPDSHYSDLCFHHHVSFPVCDSPGSLLWFHWTIQETAQAQEVFTPSLYSVPRIGSQNFTSLSFRFRCEWTWESSVLPKDWRGPSQRIELEWNQLWKTGARGGTQGGGPRAQAAC